MSAKYHADSRLLYCCTALLLYYSIALLLYCSIVHYGLVYLFVCLCVCLPIRTTFLPKWLFYYVQGYFIIRMSKVRVSRFQWRRVRRERAGLGHGLFGGNRQVPPRSSTSLHRYTNPRQYTGSAFQWLVESRSGMRYKRVCEVEFCFKKVYSDLKDVIARVPRAS